MLERANWDSAAIEATRIGRQFPDSPRVQDLEQRLAEARQRHKLALEQQFLEAAQRNDIELAMDLLKDLDAYLTEAEAEPFRETARGVIGKKRDNLGVQFKMAVHDHEWHKALTVGQQITNDFPNTKMAAEVRSMTPLLRERAKAEEAAEA